MPKEIILSEDDRKAHEASSTIVRISPYRTDPIEDDHIEEQAAPESASTLDNEDPPPAEKEAFQRWLDLKKLENEAEKTAIEKEKLKLAQAPITRFGPLILPLLGIILTGVVTFGFALLQTSLNAQRTQVRSLGDRVAAQSAEIASLGSNLSAKIDRTQSQLAQIAGVKKPAETPVPADPASPLINFEVVFDPKFLDEAARLSLRTKLLELGAREVTFWPMGSFHFYRRYLWPSYRDFAAGGCWLSFQPMLQVGKFVEFLKSRADLCQGRVVAGVPPYTDPPLTQGAQLWIIGPPKPTAPPP